LVDDGEGEGEMVDIQPIGRGTTHAFVETGNGLGDKFGWRAGSEGTGTGGGGGIEWTSSRDGEDTGHVRDGVED
jgi:hypothetical protein